MGFFIIFFMAVIFSAINQTYQENGVHKYGAITHVTVKLFQVPMLMALFIILNNKFKIIPLELKYKFLANYNSIFIVVIIISLNLTITYLLNKYLEHTEIYSLGILLRLSIVIVLIIDIITGTLVFSWNLIFYVIIFLLGMLIMFDVHLIKSHHIKSDFKKAKLIISMIIVSILLPYFKKIGINSNYFNAESILIISNIAVAFIFYIKFKPKIKLRIFKEYLVQSTVCTISLFSINLLIANYGVFYFKIAEGLMLVLIALLSRIFLHTRITKRKYLGMSIAVLGFILLSINI